MAPKKSKASKMSLNEFLGDTTLGSWADEMDSLPSAPSIKTDEDRPHPGDRFGRRDDFSSSRPDRSFASPREDLPLPTQPPYTAYVANLAFDITEGELESFFGPHETRSVKIIKDREDKPKGFGYVEFVELDGLKFALTKTGSTLSGRTVRTSVAEPPKERSGFSGSNFEDDSKFSGNWRREGPPPIQQDTRDSSRRRFDGPPGDRMPPPPSVSDDISDWRSSKHLAKIPEPEAPSFKRRGSGFSTPEGPSAADTEDKWALGSKFKPSTEEQPSRFGSLRGSHDSQHARDLPADEGDWRSGRSRTSPTSSTPPTPQMGRRKLELLPRSSANSASPSPLSSPKMASNPGAPSASKASPFGAARPVDVTTREREIAARVEKDRESLKERVPHPMSRNSSRQATERSSGNVITQSPPPQVVATPPIPGSPRVSPVTSSNVRPSFSFAHAASTKKDTPNTRAEEKEDVPIDQITEQVAEVAV